MQVLIKSRVYLEVASQIPPITMLAFAALAGCTDTSAGSSASGGGGTTQALSGTEEGTSFLSTGTA
ncbi:MAG: hypothetical protein AB8H79_11070, partial [Myxococcota bacterium]